MFLFALFLKYVERSRWFGNAGRHLYNGIWAMSMTRHNQMQQTRQSMTNHCDCLQTQTEVGDSMRRAVWASWILHHLVQSWRCCCHCSPWVERCTCHHLHLLDTTWYNLTLPVHSMCSVLCLDIPRVAFPGQCTDVAKDKKFLGGA